MKTDHTVTTTTATKDEKKKERATIMHTHTQTRASTSSKWHSRRSEKKEGRERERQTQKTAHEREIWWLNNEQKIHTNFLIQVRRSRETRRKKNGEGKRKNKQTNDWLFRP
jgi:hypothetical protein